MSIESCSPSLKDFPSIQTENPSASPQVIRQQATSMHHPVAHAISGLSSTLQDQNSLTPCKINFLLNTVDGHNGSGMQPPRTAPTAAACRSKIPAPTSMRERPSGEVTLPSSQTGLLSQDHRLPQSATPMLPKNHEPDYITSNIPMKITKAQQTLPVFHQDHGFAMTRSGPLFPTVIAPNKLSAAIPPLTPLAQSSTGMQDQSEVPASWNSRPPPAVFQLTSTRKPSSFSISSSAGPTVLQCASMEASDASAASETIEQDRKRKRNCVSSRECRQRRKEKEEEDQRIISNLKRQCQELTEDAKHYDEERQYLRKELNKHGIYPPLFAQPKRKNESLA